MTASCNKPGSGVLAWLHIGDLHTTVADAENYRDLGLVRDAVAPLRLPLHIRPGDHDFKPANLNACHEVLGAEPQLGPNRNGREW